MRANRRVPTLHRRNIRLPQWWPYALIGLGVAARLPMLSFQSFDWTRFISGWMRTLHQHGLHAFQHQFSDYSFPYLFLLWAVGHLGISDLLAVKLLSVAIDATLAFAVAVLARQLWPHVRQVAAAAIVFALPTVMLNGALWGQCDALYASIVVFAIAFACREKWVVASALVGAALAVKLQTVFVVPALLILWWSRDRRLRSIASSAAAFAIFTLPPVLFGQPVTQVLGTYRGQSHEYPALTLNAPNLYQWWPWSSHAGDITAAALTAIALVAVAAFATRGRLQVRVAGGPLFARAAAALCCFGAVILPFVLPHMHERYFYLAETLSVVLSFGLRSALRAALVLQVSTTLAYLPFLTGQTPIPLPVVALLTLLAIGAVAMTLWKELSEHASAASAAITTSGHRAEAHSLPADATVATVTAP